MKRLKRSVKQTACALLAAAALVLSGCENTADGKSGTVSSPSLVRGSSSGSSSGSSKTSASSASSESDPPVTVPTEPQEEEAHFDFGDDDPEPYYIPVSADIRVPSLSEALGRFDEISDETPSGTPAEIVRTLMERNVLCFASLQAQCWSFDSEYDEDFYYARGTAPIQSKYLKSAKQIDSLFYGTYTKEKADFLIHYYDGDDTYDAFYESGGELCATFSEILRTANDSFKTTTYVCITNTSKNRIEFNRYYTQHPKDGTPQPNNYTFAAVREEGKWRLEQYIIDAPSYMPLYTNLITTARAGSPDLVAHAVKQAGNFGGEPYWDWYGFDYRIEWCAAFVSWCYNEAGMNGPFFIACNSEGIEWFKEMGQWRDRSFRDIAPGDCIFLDWDLNGSANHVGMVIGTNGKKVYTIEGNRCDTCRTCEYDLDDERIFGYGIIDWNKYN